MIRWRYLIPRLAIVLIVLAVLQLASGPAAGWIAQIAYERATGGRLDIAESRVGMFPPLLTFRGVQFADPRRERENIAEFDTLEFKFDGEQLLHRRFVIDLAKFAGLRFSTERSHDGRVPVAAVTEAEAPSQVGTAIDAMTDWVSRMADEKSSAAIESLETVQLSRALEDEWKVRYETELKRARRIETAIKTIRDNGRSIDNPLRDLPRVAAALKELEQLGQDLQVARQVMAELPARLQTDRLRLEEARNRDTQQLANYLPNQGKFESFDQLTGALLEKYYVEPLRQLRNYVALGKSAGDMTVLKPKADRTRGVDHDLDGRSDDPILFVRRCELAGNLSIDQSDYVLTGLIDGFALASRPMPLRMRMKLLGKQEIGIDYQRSPENALAHHLVLHIPSLPAQETTIKAGKALVIRSAPVPLELWADVYTDGNQLQGRLVARQQGSTLTASLKGENDFVKAVESSVNESLAKVQVLDMEATLGGEWDRPRINIQSNLQPVIAQAFGAATTRLASVAQAKLQEEVNHVHQEQTAKLEAFVQRQRVELDKLLTQAEQKKQELTASLASVVNRSPINVGRLQDVMKRVQ